MFSHCVRLVCSPIDYSPPGSFCPWNFPAGILEWVAISSSRDLPDPGIRSASWALAGRFFTSEPPGKTTQDLVISYFQFSSVQLLSLAQLFATPWTAAHQASLSIANSRSLLKLMSIESLVMLSNLLIFCHPFLLLPSIFPIIRVFSSESVLHIRWPILEFQLQYQSFQ